MSTTNPMSPSSKRGAARAAIGLDEYRQKRRFDRTQEPQGGATAAEKSALGGLFVIQKHDASHLHYDFRLEVDGVLKSWAVPKGPSLDPSVKRLAIEVEDHPLEYGDFEGTIPKGEYGGGTVLLWDRGTFTATSPVADSLRRGKLHFTLKGEKLHGEWLLLRTGPQGGSAKPQWLLRKLEDESARVDDILESEPESVKTGRSLAKSNGVTRSRTSKSPNSRSSEASGSFSERNRVKAATSAPAFQTPQLAYLAPQPPRGRQWVHELKLDGYRILARVHKGAVTLFTRGGGDWTSKFPEIADALKDKRLGEAMIDGEIVALTSQGLSSFQDLQNAIRTGAAGELVYFVFDLLYANEDLRSQSLQARRARLAKLFPDDANGPIRRVEMMRGDGPAAFRAACERGAEGIISKRLTGQYHSGRSGDWLKSKCVKSADFLICGWDDSTKASREVRSLLLGYYDKDNKLHYAGRVGTGFNHTMLAELKKRLEGTSENPFDVESAPARRKATHWAKPTLVAHVQFAEWTKDRVLRSPSFLGIREDAMPKKVVHPPPDERSFVASKAFPAGVVSKSPSRRNADVGLEGVHFTHPGKVYFAGAQITKLELAAYYHAIVDWILPHIEQRPLSLLRCPDGEQGSCFFQKHLGAGSPSAIDGVRIKESAQSAVYPVVKDAAGLLSLVQIGTLEIHPWGSRADDVEKPDRIVFDLDPGPNVAWADMIAAALSVRKALQRLDLESFVKTSGKKGLHVLLPIERRSSWDDVSTFARGFAGALAASEPERYTINQSKKARPSKIYLDYRRNSRGATTVAAYSTRATPDANVSMPIAWSELTVQLRPDQFTVTSALARLSGRRKDPWKAVASVKQRLTEKLVRAATTRRE